MTHNVSYVRLRHDVSVKDFITSIINRKAEDAVLHSTNDYLIHIMPAQ